MGQFKEGQIKPEGSGRKKGTPNKKSKYLNEQLISSGLDVPKRIMELLPDLPKEKQADILMGLMAFLYPKRKAVEITDAPSFRGVC